MGASHTTLASTSVGGEEGLLPELDGGTAVNNADGNKNASSHKHDLTAYALDQPLFPGSGRMMRTFRLRHKQNVSMVVLKSMYVSKEQEALVKEQEQELTRILEALEGQAHVAPFLYWSLGPYRQKPVLSNNLPTMVRQVSLVRPYIYTTLSDRLASRPFLTNVEKLWIVYQLLQALEAMHAKGVVHGCLTTENIGLSSWNWVVILDIASYKARTALPDDDPTEYLYYFQENYSHSYAQGTDTTRREKRCYLAPERFYTPNLEQPQPEQKRNLTPAMDIFSAGCVLMETFLNGERALDLGDLMEYRKQQSSTTLQQKFNKIEFSALRAACRHMLHLDPNERLSASAYLERLEASELIPSSFPILATMMERVTFAAPDARLAIIAAFYSKLLEATIGVHDANGAAYVQNILGATMSRQIQVENAITKGDAVESETNRSDVPKPSSSLGDQMIHDPSLNVDLFAETDALLKQLESLNFDEDEVQSIATKDVTSLYPNESPGPSTRAPQKRSEMSQSSLLIYLQLILSTVRHVQRPSSKLVALQLIHRLGKFSSDEARLQRIVPVTVSLLQDHDSLVRASAIQVLASTVGSIQSFPPSDSKVFPEYIFKRVAHLITDPALVVRIAFAKSVAILAEASQRFLDISHAVRLYEAVGGGGASTNVPEKTGNDRKESTKNVFTDDVARLLDESSSGVIGKKKKLEYMESSGMDSTSSDGAVGSGKNLITSTYTKDLASLQETVSRWVVHIATDQSEQSSPTKRALLADMARLCHFFGLDGVMAFILPQVLSFLNDRKDWQLRAALFDCLPSVCHIIGRAATEHFVLPCLESALVDGSETVISRALKCLSQLLHMGLLSRSILHGTPTLVATKQSQGLLNKYVALLVHPSADIRYFAISTINVLCKSLGSPDAEVFVVPILRPFLRFQPKLGHLTTRQGLEACLQPPWTRQQFNEELTNVGESQAKSPTSSQWTSIGIKSSESPTKVKSTKSMAKDEPNELGENDLDAQTHPVRLYLQLLARNRMYHPQTRQGTWALRTHLNHTIEGSLKLSQQIKFPKQNVVGLPTSSLPAWYSATRESLETKTDSVPISVAIRSVSALGEVYGLSVMDQGAGSVAQSPSEDFVVDRAVSLVESEESKQIEAACTGEWGSEIYLDPTLTDTSLLLTKLNALQVPPLPPRLIQEKSQTTIMATPSRGNAKEQASAIAGPEWKFRIDTMVASSKCSPEHGHVAPIVRLVVAQDQSFFVTGSHDATCRIWELEKAERSNGLLESSAVYTGHQGKLGSKPRINDLAMVEGGHSVVSGASDGSVHVWRVDLVSSSKQNVGLNETREVSRVAGTSEIRRSNPNEGEILAVNHFNTSSASICAYATQKGLVHSWDLRSALEPFVLTMPHDTGYITSMAMGSDRNWLVTGTSKGFITLWDLRFQQILKLWHHSRNGPVNRLATSFVPPPQSWIGRGNVSNDARPFLFAACGPNECAMFDISTGACHECFRTVEYGSRSSRTRLEEMPILEEVPLSTSARRRVLMTRGIQEHLQESVSSSLRSVNAMVGSIGASDHSFLITGGSDCRIRFWDFAMPSKCYVSTGPETIQPRPSFERIDYNQSCRLMLCRQPPTPTLNEVEGSKIPRKLLQGTKKFEKTHEDAITDLKVVKGGLLSCSRDCTVKLWR